MLQKLVRSDKCIVFSTNFWVTCLEYFVSSFIFYQEGVTISLIISRQRYAGLYYFNKISVTAATCRILHLYCDVKGRKYKFQKNNLYTYIDIYERRSKSNKPWVLKFRNNTSLNNLVNTANRDAKYDLSSSLT